MWAATPSHVGSEFTHTMLSAAPNCICLISTDERETPFIDRCQIQLVSIQGCKNGLLGTGLAVFFFVFTADVFIKLCMFSDYILQVR